jgi:hypothetical protein
MKISGKESLGYYKLKKHSLGSMKDAQDFYGCRIQIK